MNDPKLDKIKEELKQKQCAVVKLAVQKTFEKLEALEAQKNALLSNIKVLKHELFDLKDGRLDRIIERHSINEEVQAISVIALAKVSNASNSATSPWYEDYDIKVRTNDSVIDCRVNNSVTKIHASGTYKMPNGEIKYL